MLSSLTEDILTLACTWAKFGTNCATKFGKDSRPKFGLNFNLCQVWPQLNNFYLTIYKAHRTLLLSSRKDVISEYFPAKYPTNPHTVND